MLLRTELTTDLPCGSCLPLVFLAEPLLAIGLEVVGGGSRVNVSVPSMAAEVKQAIQRVLDLLRVAAAGVQDVVIHSITRTIQVGAC